MSKFYIWIITEFDEAWTIRASNMKDSRNRMKDLVLEDYSADVGEIELNWNEQKGFGYVFFNNLIHPGIFLAG